MFNFLKGRLKFIRLCLLVSVLALVAVGIAAIYAVGNPVEPSQTSKLGEVANLWKKQLMFAGVSLICFVAVNIVNYRRLGSISYWIFVCAIALLAYLLVSRYIIELPFAPENEHKAHCWLVFHPMLPRIQPSEFFKLAYILTLAWYLRYRSNYRNFRALIGPFLLTLLPIVLILLEPDLGTVVLMMPILFTMLFIAGAKVKHFLLIVLMAILVSPLLWYKMRPYQRIRISSVLLQSAWVRQKAENHPWLGKVFVGTRFSEGLWKSDWGWHLIRAKYAVASGGFKGFGFRRGDFVKYDFLKERHNDFIFAVIAQQWGFLGCIGLLMLYAVVIICGLEIAANNTDPFGRLLAIGIIAMFTVEVLVNVSMTVGLMPITGLTLPFISYGGSSLLVNMMSVGLLNNVGRCRPFSVARKT